MSSAAQIDAGSIAEARSGRAARDIPDWMRIALNGTVIVVFWNHLWFADLSDRSLLEAAESGSLLTQGIFIALALAMGAALWRLGLERLRPLMSWPILLCAGWLALTILTSVEPLLSIRRAILLLIAAMLAAGVLVVARSARQFALTLAASALIIVISSFLAVALVPQLSVHSAFDVQAEPDHAGLWRGIFPHKNEAGSVMVILILVGLYVAATLSRFTGWVIVLLSAIFLVGTNSKTAMATVPVILAVTGLCQVFRGPWLRALLLVAPILAFSILSIGSIFLPPVKDVLELLLKDASFTGRSEIWQFAVDNILVRPVQGWGYGAFWLTERTMYGSATISTWVNGARHAHNAFLDTALTTGLPGLGIALLVYLYGPLRDLNRIAGARTIDPTTMLFIRLWFFAMISASFESVLFNGNNPTCCMVMLAIFGLRMRTQHALVRR
ncbi:O-antigen ligase [Methylobacterium sp. BE186]|uniref:O-antigen ligase family protein n=1 Tax=Methylobacterium sp. BE186 TaxID=2817715 RepID=UPI002854DB0A|nr:O-antigen ligase [Methylobacterium sp. BE186]MDR7038873.1 O-antigen ligase [Methylobacterium sp. BE186]